MNALFVDGVIKNLKPVYRGSIFFLVGKKNLIFLLLKEGDLKIIAYIIK